MNIAIFVFAYPVLSETFVINELFQLQEMNVRGEIWREKNGAGGVHPKAQKLLFPVHYCPEKVFGAEFKQILSAHVWWILKEPLHYFELLSEVLSSFPDIESVKIFIKAAVTARQVRDSGVEVVYVHESDRAFVFGLCAARLNKIPLVIIFHTYYLFVQPRYIQQKVRLATNVIFQSEYSKMFVAQKIGVGDMLEKLCVISLPGIDTTFFSPSKKRSFALKKMRILSIGRLEEAKGFTYLIDAIALLRKAGVDAVVNLVGDGSLRPLLEKQVNVLKLQKYVTFTGSLPHDARLQKALNDAEYFVLPSIQDSEGVHDVHPNALKEAMAAGLIPVTTELGGIDEVIKNGKDGFIVKNADPKTLATALRKLNGLSPKEKLKMSASARKKIESTFESDHLTHELLKLFERNEV